MTSFSARDASRSLRTDARTSIGRILDAAQALLGGAGGVSLSHIAREAGVGAATLYRHFPSREALAGAVLDRMFDDEVESLLAEFSSGDACRDDLLAVAERLVELLRRERGVVASVGNAAEVIARFLARDGRLAETVRRAQRAGNLRPDIEVDDLPILLGMLITGLGVLETDSTARRRYLSLLLDGLNPSGAVVLPRIGAAPVVS